MQTTISLKAQKRTGGGKGPARRLRASGKLPAIVYGPGHEAVLVAVDPKDVRTILGAPLGRNTVVTVDIEGASQLAMLKSFDYHPISRDLEHADFYTVALDRPIVVVVPFATTGKARGLSEGGVLRQVFRKLPIKCAPDKIPAKIEIDVSDVGLGNALHTRDLKLPDGVVVMLDPGQTIVAVVAPEKEKEPLPGTPGAPGAAAAGAPAAGAPAAGAAAAGGDKKGAAAGGDKKAAAPAGDKGAKKK